MFQRTLLSLTLLGLAVSAAAPSTASAEPTITESPAAPRTRVNLETDPFDFFLGGYGLVVGVRPSALPHWRLSVATFALDLPSFLVEIDDANKGFSLRIDHGFGATGSYHFSEASGGFYVGPAIGYFINEYSRDDLPGMVTTVHSFNVGAQGGYQWFPLKQRGFYLQPWMNASVPLYTSRDPKVGDREFHSPPVNVNLLLHVGYEL
ncbi:MAG: hypothetical protein H6Q90_2318 [Deltaproteobacteria bacterium]|nr:hypothetical protein [Deltaproteobacteria bacterium]